MQGLPAIHFTLSHCFWNNVYNLLQIAVICPSWGLRLLLIDTLELDSCSRTPTFKEPHRRVYPFVFFHLGDELRHVHVCLQLPVFRRVFQHTISFPVFAICFLFLTVSSVSTSSLPSLPAYVSLSLLLFLKTSSSSGTRRDRSVSGSPWCNTTTVTSTLCSLCTTSPARPASAACPPGQRSAGRTRWDRTSPGGYRRISLPCFYVL